MMYRLLWVLSLLFIVSAIITGLLILPSLPAEIPSHWNSVGDVDGWQTSLMYIWLMPFMALVLLGILGSLSVRMPNSRVCAHIAMSAALLTAFILGLHALIGVRSFAGQMITPAEFMRVMAGLFVGLAFIIKDVPPNHVVGFRLPWTINDVDTWTKTHKVGFWGMGIGGISCGVITIMPITDEYVFGLGICAIMIGIIIPSIYSYWYWRNHTHGHAR